MEEQNKRKSIIYLTIGVLTLIALIAGATYAYFQAQTENNAVANLNTTTGTTDNLTFSTDGNILINASADNCGENMGDRVSTATANATLIPNNTTNNASDTYNVYLAIKENTFVYTTGESTPELILSVKKDGEYYQIKNEDQKENISIQYKKKGQEALTTETIKGYDITTKDGLIKIAEGETITANEKQEIDNWEIKIILKNLISDQNNNTGKTFNGKIIIQKEKLADSAVDLSGNGYNGTFENGAVAIPDEEGNIGVYFDGIDDYVDIVDLPDTIDWESGFNVEFEAKWLAFNKYSRIFEASNGPNSNNIYIANTNYSSNLVLSVYGKGKGHVISSGQLLLNEKNVVKMTYTKTETGYNLNTNINGVDQPVITHTPLLTNITRTSNYMGKSNWSIDGYFNGYIYNLKITDSTGKPIIWYDFSK